MAGKYPGSSVVHLTGDGTQFVWRVPVRPIVVDVDGSVVPVGIFGVDSTDWTYDSVGLLLRCVKTPAKGAAIAVHVETRTVHIGHSAQIYGNAASFNPSWVGYEEPGDESVSDKLARAARKIRGEPEPHEPTADDIAKAKLILDGKTRMIDLDE